MRKLLCVLVALLSFSTFNLAFAEEDSTAQPVVTQDDGTAAPAADDASTAAPEQTEPLPETK
jgi:hypothetical protein